MRKEYLLALSVVGGSLLLIGGLAALGSRPRKPIADVTTACVRHQGGGMHIHPRLQIVIDGQERPIPVNVGVTPTCMRPLHTHSGDGLLHLEFPVEQEVRLGQFFQIWQQPFSATQVLERTVGDGEVLGVTVNGRETAERGNLLLHDGDKIVIEVKKRE